jgi:hypothetical protein
MTNNYAKRVNSPEIVFFDSAVGAPVGIDTPAKWAVWKLTKGLSPAFRVVGESSDAYCSRNFHSPGNCKECRREA